MSLRLVWAAAMMGGTIVTIVMLAVAVTRAAPEPVSDGREFQIEPPLVQPSAASLPTTTDPPMLTPTIQPTVTASPTDVPPTATPMPTQTPVPAPTETALPPTVIPSTATPVPTEAPPALTLNGDPDWADAIHTTDGAVMGVITAVELNIRDAPSLNAAIVTTTYERHTVTVYELVASPDDGDLWYRVGAGRYLSAWYVEPFVAPPPKETYAGHWVDVNLSAFYAIAYDGDTPVYAAIIAAGRDGKTPIGEFHVFYRVEDEVMDSATVGIPKGDPAYYYLEHVLYTQYFKEGGYAIHGNYWTPPSQFGGFTSNGCVGLMNHDAGWFFQFLSEGSMINIHV
ncbi:MAG: L,D-transpeptidase family protein [Vicinamibacterales bacterium]